MEYIKEKILNTLTEAADKHQVKIPIAIESGSRGWGFPSLDSDYDCRFIYIHEPDWYLSLQQKSDVIEYCPDAIYDINGWDLKKVMQHIIKSNATIHEWLSSDVTYIIEETIHQELWQLAVDFFNPLAVSHHYLSCAINKMKEVTVEHDSKIKKYFYILRPLANLRYIKDYHQIPPMNYYDTLAKIDTPVKVLAEIEYLKQLKPESKESDLLPENLILKSFFQEEISFFTNYLKELSFSRYKNYEKADDTFRKIIRMVWNNEWM